MIYLIQNKENNLCKIGFSSDPLRRLKQIQQEYPKSILLFSMPGGRAGEAAVQWNFGQKRVFGEWFKLTKIDIGLITSVDELGFIQATNG